MTAFTPQDQFLSALAVRLEVDNAYRNNLGLIVEQTVRKPSHHSFEIWEEKIVKQMEASISDTDRSGYWHPDSIADEDSVVIAQTVLDKLQHDLEDTRRKRAALEIKIACGEAAKLFLRVPSHHNPGAKSYWAWHDLGNISDSQIRKVKWYPWHPETLLSICQ